MHKNAIKMVWGVNFLGKIFVALFLALFGKKMAPLNSKHLATLPAAKPCPAVLLTKANLTKKGRLRDFFRLTVSSD